MPSSLLELATNPLQYDSLEDWGQDRSGHEAFFKRQIIPLQHLWDGKRVLEVGAGTGWLMDFFQRTGASWVLGIEPSSKQVTIAANRYPQLDIKHTSFEQFSDKIQFDLVVSHMSIMHIPELIDFFTKAGLLLNVDGAVHLTVPDPEYFTSNSRGVLLHEPISQDIEVIQRPGGTTDIIRSLRMFREAAIACGFSQIGEQAISPDQDYMKLNERYAALNGAPIAHSLVFKK